MIDDTETEIEVIDDTPEEDRGKPVAPLEEADDSSDESGESHEEELSSYSKRVKERIDQLTRKAHSERRAKEVLARQLQEAVGYTKKVVEETNRLKGLVTDGETVLITQARERLRSDQEMAKANLRKAYEDGDAEKIAEAHAILSRVAADQANMEQWRPQPFSPTPVPEMPVIQTNTPDPEAEEWQARNPWFLRDQEMTQAAMQIHQRLVYSGVQPNTPEYYRKVDEGMRRRFPEVLGTEEAPQTQERKQFQPVAAVSRGAPGKPTKVKLTQSQVALAQRLGITPQQYAAQLVKEI